MLSYNNLTPEQKDLFSSLQVAIEHNCDINKKVSAKYVEK